MSSGIVSASGNQSICQVKSLLLQLRYNAINDNSGLLWQQWTAFTYCFRQHSQASGYARGGSKPLSWQYEAMLMATAVHARGFSQPQSRLHPLLAAALRG